MTTSLLEVTNLTKRYEGVIATDDLTLSVVTGEWRERHDHPRKRAFEPPVGGIGP